MSRAVLLVFALACSKSERAVPSAEELHLSKSMARDALVSVRAAIERARARAEKPDWSADAYQRMEKPNLEAFMSCRLAAGCYRGREPRSRFPHHRRSSAEPPERMRY